LGEKKRRPITIYLDEDLFRELTSLSEKEGATSVSDFIVKIIKEKVSGVEKPIFDESLKSKIARIVQDEVNKHLQAVEKLRRQITELYEKVDALSATIEELKSKTPEISETRREKKKTGIERLKEERVVFESNLPKKLNRDAFFNYLRREGAVVIETSKERIAVDPEFWRDFENKLFEKANTNNEEDLKKILGDKGFMLFTKLRDDNQVIFDSSSRKWRNLINVAG